MFILSRVNTMNVHCLEQSLLFSCPTAAVSLCGHYGHIARFSIHLSIIMRQWKYAETKIFFSVFINIFYQSLYHSPFLFCWKIMLIILTETYWWKVWNHINLFCFYFRSWKCIPQNFSFYLYIQKYKVNFIYLDNSQ